MIRSSLSFISIVTTFEIQWLASGITNAEAAEAEVSSDYEHAQSLMNKALYCFRQANNDLFARKAEIQLESFGLRIKIFKANREGTLLAKDGAGCRLELETEAVDSMENLLKENLLLEVKGLGRDMKKLLQVVYPSSAFLESMLLQHLPEGGGYTY